MRKIFIAACILSVNFLTAQEDITFETTVKKLPNQEAAAQPYHFNFLQKQELIVKTDLTTGSKQEFKVDFDHGGYTPDGKNYTITFVTKATERTAGRFTLIYDVTRTNILGVKNQLNEKLDVAYYLTKSGSGLTEVN